MGGRSGGKGLCMWVGGHTRLLMGSAVFAIVYTLRSTVVRAVVS